MTTVLFVGAGRHQRRAIEQARALGLRVVAVDRNPDAPGLVAADIAEVVDFMEIDAVVAVARRVGVDGVLTVSADRAVPVVAAVAEELGLPGIGRSTAHLLTHKLAMRARWARAGFLSRRSRASGPNAMSTRPWPPSASRPSSSRSTPGGQRAVFRIESRAELERDLPEALAESPTGEAILEGFVEGVEMNGIVIARGLEPALVTLSDRLRPPGIGFGVGWIHVYPPSVNGDQLALSERAAVESVRALGLRDAIAFPQLIASPDGGVAVVEVAAHSRRADGRPRSARGRSRSRRGRAAPSARRRGAGRDRAPPIQAAARDPLLHGTAGPLPTGEVVRIGSLGPCSPRRASCRRTRTSRSARRSAPYGVTATGVAT